MSSGCAKQTDCINPLTGTIYDGEALVNPLVGSNPAGMLISPYCCTAEVAPSDDSIAINYNNICNSASKTSSVFIVNVIALSMLVGYFIF